MIDKWAQDVAERFGIGASSGPLINSFLGFVSQELPGGYNRLLINLAKAGHSEAVESWITEGPLFALPVSALDQVIGNETVAEIGRRVGVPTDDVKAPIAFILPQIIRALAVDGTIPKSLPAWAMGSMPPTNARQVEVPDLFAEPDPITPTPQSPDPVRAQPKAMPHANVPPPKTAPAPKKAMKTPEVGGILGSLPRGVLAGVSALLIIAMVGAGANCARGKAAAKPKEKVEQSKVVDTLTDPAELSLFIKGGKIRYAGTVANPAMRDDLLESIEGIDPDASGELLEKKSVARPSWMSQINEILTVVGSGPAELIFKGDELTITAGGNRDRSERLQDKLSDLLGASMTIRIMDFDELTAEGNAKALKSLSRLGLSFNMQELVDALNMIRINFKAGSSELPEESLAILGEAADALRRADDRINLVITGHTDNTGASGANLALSKRRAESVKKYLVALQVDARSLKTEGKGQEAPIDTNDTELGRFNNRRIEFSVAEVVAR